MSEETKIIETVIKPRKTNVLIQMKNINTISQGSKIIAPHSSQLGKEYVVLSMGPDVKELNIGDKVLIIGQRGVNWDFLPNSTELLCCDESLIALRFTPKEEVNE